MDEGKIKPGQTVAPQKPGEVVVAVDHSADTKPAEPAVVVSSDAPAATEPVPTEEVEEFQDDNEQQEESDENSEAEAEAITWTASEYVAHEKTAGWFITLILFTIALSALVLVLTKDKISVAVVVFGAFVLGYFASRKPRQLEYTVDPEGINIGPKRFNFEEFRSFGIIPEGAFSSIIFMPHRRFAMPISIYYPPEDENKIAKVIGQQLPLEEHTHDLVDKFMRQIRF